MKITLLEPYFTGSHASWAREYAAYSRHQVEILSLPGRHWKWRMHGGAVTLARKFIDSSFHPDLLLASDMLDLTTFLTLTRGRSAQCKTALYFHENQLTYPWSPDDCDQALKRDAHYGFINYASALAADAILFNSSYHFHSFVDELPRFLKSFPDKNELRTVEMIRQKCRVLYLGMDLRRFDPYRPAKIEGCDGRPPLVLWNHRWEYDKNPEEFFAVLERSAAAGLDFQVAILGESFSDAPTIFREVRERMGNRVVQFGFVKSFVDYATWLWQADILPVTSRHDFFGASVVQAIYCNCYPLLPNRLAYPEHIPNEHHTRFFYEDTVDLGVKLEGLLRNCGDSSRQPLRGFVARYDWQRMAPEYDDFFERLTSDDTDRN